MLETTDGKLIKKAKGVNSNYLTSDDFKNMYYNKKILIQLNHSLSQTLF
jgi:hypothetical protein